MSDVEGQNGKLDEELFHIYFRNIVFFLFFLISFVLFK